MRLRIVDWSAMMDVIVFPPNIMSCHPFSMTGEGEAVRHGL
jgi:hypothetical protein